METDADQFEGRIEGVKDELRKIRGRLTAVLIAITTGSVLLALNLGIPG